MELRLASGSPRRRELVKLFGVPVTVCPADIDETLNPDAIPYDEAARLSRRKAEALTPQPGQVILAADTMVVLGSRILGKPANVQEAKEMLTALSGHSHQVMTGCTLRTENTCVSFTEVTEIHFRELTEEEIDRYIATGEPMDKAGAYGIQGGAALFCTGMIGDFYNVMGLPVCRVYEELQKLPQWKERQG